MSTNRRAVPWEVARQSARADLCAALEDLFRLYNAFRSASGFLKFFIFFEETLDKRRRLLV